VSILKTVLAAASAVAVLAVATAVQAAPQTMPIRVLSVTRLSAGKAQGVRVDRIMYTNDGLSLEALVALPSDAVGRHPIVVVLHGGWALAEPQFTHYPFGETAPSLVWLESLYPNAIVVAPEYRGYMLSGGHPGMLEAEASDARAAIRVLARDFQGNSRAVYLLGYSMGGGVALALAGQMPGIRAVVGVSPFVGYDIDYRWEAVQETTDKDKAYGVNAAEIRTVSFLTHFGGTPAQQPEAYAAQSPDTHIDRITAPVLLLQGTADQSVLWQATREFANKLADAGKTVKFVLYPGGQHGLHTAPYQAESNAEILAWFTLAGLS
jgi:dipeptidyl aminopeptidase/acylaminoacyl peptidase